MESKVNSYKLNQNNKEYILTIGLIGNLIRISCKNSLDPSQNYSRDFTLNELQQLDEIFKTISTPLEAVNYLDKALGNQQVGISEIGNNLKVNFFITTEGSALNLDNLTFGQQTENQYNTQINTYTVESTGVNYENTNYGVGSDENTYGSYDSSNVLQNVQYSTDYSQYGTTFGGIVETADQYQNIETTNYTSQYGENLGTDILSQYQTGAQDLTAQYTGETTNIMDQYTYGTQQYTGDNQDYSSYIGSGDNYVQSYTTTETTNQYIQPTVDKDIQTSNQYYQTTTTTTKTTNVSVPQPPPQTLKKSLISIPLPKVRDEQDLLRQTQNEQKIIQLEGATNSLKDENLLIHDKLKALAGQLNSCRTQISLVGKNSNNYELNSLREENRAIKQQLAELNKLRNDAAEVKFLRSQIKELDPLRRKAAEMDFLRGQLQELNILRAKVAELERVKGQLSELNRLKEQVNKMNLMKQQLGELPSLRAKVAELNSVKTQLGELNSLKSQVSQINLLKSQINELIAMKENTNDSDNLRKTIFDLEKKKLEYEYE